MPRVRISNNSLNSYGFRILTEGGNIEQYQKNPVLLFMHRRGEVMGFMKDIKVEGEELSAEPVFDEVTPLSKQLKQQWEFGSLKMTSAGIEIIEVSEDPKYLVPGQTRPTITKWKLKEVSMVDIGANDDAIALTHEGKVVELSGEKECGILPLINNKPKSSKMDELKQIALALGLSEGASLAEVTAKITTLTQASARITELETENGALQLSAITALVSQARVDKKITTEKESHFIDLGKKIGIESLKETLAAMAPAVRLSGLAGAPAGGKKPETGEYKKLSDVPSSELLALRSDDPETYCRLYKAEYGFDCKL